jgi:TatD DNase family protein
VVKTGGFTPPALQFSRKLQLPPWGIFAKMKGKWPWSWIVTLPELVDSHCHLDFADFDGETEAIIARAAEAGVRRMVTICTKLENEARVRAIAEAHAGVFFAVGLHPMSVGEAQSVSVADLIGFARHPKMVGIGETGLDYHYTPDSADVQKRSLRLHIEAAQETGLPLIIHARAADGDMEQILAEGMAIKPYSCVMHCFSSGARLAEAALEMGFYLSMSGIATFPKSGELRDIFARAPLNRILVETDSPYLAPVPFRGRRNEPAYTAFTAKTGATVFGVSEADFAAATTANFDRLFTKAQLVAQEA